MKENKNKVHCVMDGAGSVTGKKRLFFHSLAILLSLAQQCLVLIIKELLTLTDVMIYSAFFAPATQRIKLEWNGQTA